MIWALAALLSVGCLSAHAVDPATPVPAEPGLAEQCFRSLTALPGKSNADALKAACAKAEQLPECESEKGVPIFHVQKAARPEEKQVRKVLVFALIHGDEFPAGSVARSWIERLTTIEPRSEWRVVPILNPDGLKNKTRYNAHGVDLNRNFPTADWNEKALKYWEKNMKRDKRRFPGKTANSEKETHCAIAQIDDYKPDLILSIHTPYGVLDFDGPKLPSRPEFPKIPWKNLGTYPGSLGRYMWLDRSRPTLTVELQGKGVVEKLEEFDRLQDMSGDIAIKAEAILQGKVPPLTPSDRPKAKKPKADTSTPLKKCRTQEIRPAMNPSDQDPIPAPSAGAELDKKLRLTLETKRLIGSVEKEIESLDWQVTDRFGSAPRLSGPAHHLLSAGGKRVRPLLVCLLSRALDVPFERLSACAVAAELVHTATLLHDDILDGATTRRGRITAHLKYDAHTTILSGDALLAKAISDMAELGDPEILKRLAQTVRELVEGECLQADLMGQVHGDVDAVMEVARRKTASLFAWVAWVSGHRAGRHADDLFRFGTHLGLAFQVLDDILDWEGKDTGKERYTDIHETKLNTLGVKLVQLSKHAAGLLEGSFSQKDAHGYIPNPAKLGEALQALPEYAEALHWARREAEDHSAFALSHLDRLPASLWKDLTKQLTQSLLERMK